MTFYTAKANTIVDEQGRQLAVVLPTNCTKKLAREMAAYAAQQANHAEAATGAIRSREGRQGMKERPILFSAPMVRALLAGTKTQTRRTVKLPHMNPLGVWEPQTIGGPNGGHTARGETIPEQGAIWHTRTGDSIGCPYGQPGDQLWVRESGLEHRTTQLFIHDATPGRWWTPKDGGRYGASYSEAVTRSDLLRDHRVRPSIHMPRWASRIQLEVTAVRVERLQAISESDCIAEGIEPIGYTGPNPGPNRFSLRDESGGSFNFPTAAEAYRFLWESINGVGSWEKNPWVWIVTFRRLEARHGST